MSTEEIVRLIDGENWGILELTGKDRQQFLHNQTTNDINRLTPGKGIDTVFVSSTARTLEIATVYNLEDSIWIIVSRETREFLLQWIDRYIFPADHVNIQDITSKYRILKLIGDQAGQLLRQISSVDLTTGNYGDHQLLGSPRVAIGTGLDLPGYTLMIPEQEYYSYKELLLALGTIELSHEQQEELRIRQGKPRSGRELTDDYNALEAGLWRSISFEKGCYIGQETIARLNTYQGVKQRLWGVVNLKEEVAAGSPIFIEHEKVGILTSCCKTISQEVIGLGYIKSKAGGEGLEITVGNTKGIIVAVPYLTHDYYRP